jgi:hypothetical protein
MNEDEICSSDDLDVLCRIIYATEDPGTYTVVVPWNHISEENWKQAAVVAGDHDWTETKRIANDHLIEAMELSYSGGKLQGTQYHIAWRGSCGYGYKGGGMTNREKEDIDHHFLEVESKKHIYVFIRWQADNWWQNENKIN